MYGGYGFGSRSYGSGGLPAEIPGPLATYETLPYDLAGIARVRFMLRSNTQTFESPLSGSVQTLELSGARWEAQIIIPPMERVLARQWIAFLSKLRGAQGRFYVGDPAGRTPRGSGSGFPWIDGPGQTGTKIKTKRWTANSTGVLKKGDYIMWDTPTGWREMHIVTEDVNGDANGKAIIDIAPSIRESPKDGAILHITEASCVMHLSNDEQIVWEIGKENIYEISFNAVEVFK